MEQFKKTVETIKIWMTNVQETSAINQLKWLDTFWDVATMRLHHWILPSMVEDCKWVTRIIFEACGEGSVRGVHFQKPISLFADAPSRLILYTQWLRKAFLPSRTSTKSPKTWCWPIASNFSIIAVSHFSASRDLVADIETLDRSHPCDRRGSQLQSG